MRTRILLVVAAAVGFLVVVALVLALVRPGRFLGSKPPEGPSAEDIYARVRPVLKPWENAVLAEKGQFEPQDKQHVIDALAAATSIYQNDDNGKIALARLADEVRELIRTARKKEAWQLALDGTEIFGAFRKNEFFIRFYTEMVEKQLARPQVTLRGFIEDIPKNTIYAFVDVRLPKSNKVLSLQVRPGEEFLDPPHTLRFAEIIGDNRGIRLEFMAIPGDTFDVMLRK
jgi:hypothetical protein